MKKALAPEPMALMRKREKMIDDLYPLPYVKPERTYGQVHKTAAAVAAWDLNDPFAYGRTALYVRQGYIDPEKTQEEYTKRTLARRVAREREAEKEMRAYVTANKR